MKRILIVLASLCAVYGIEAKVVLPNVLGDNMVLQRNTEVKLWGMATPSRKVSVTPSWSGETVVVKADKSGKWTVSLKTGEAGGPYDIVFDDGERLVVDNVLLGEVWFCSGQSNMEMPVKGFDNQPVDGAVEVMLEARRETPVRMCTVRRTTAYEEKDDCQAEWLEHTPANVASTSATAYFFAEYLQKVLDVPVGIIVASWGGTRVEAWMNRDAMGAFQEYDLSYLDTKEKAPRWDAPCLMYNAMVVPVRNYTVKGFLWYQGEANRYDPERYSRLLPAYAKMMRDVWNLGELPFYYVQIAPYRYEKASDVGSAYLREAQMKSMSEIPNSGMAVTLDIGDRDCIHPARKLEVGHRLAYMALERDYGFDMIESFPPMYESMEVKDGKALLSFKVGRLGMCPLGRSLTGFEVAGEDKVFHPAKALIKGGNKVEVWCEDVPVPAAVRYCFHNWDEASLYNSYGIPSSSFRTDNW